MDISWALDNTVGTLVNQAQLQLRVQCSGNSTICSGAGLMTPYTSNLATTQLSGTAASDADAVLQTLSFDSLATTGTNVLFTGVPTAIQPGGVVGASNIMLSSINSVISALSGYTLTQADAQSIGVSYTGMDWLVSVTTNAAAVGSFALPSGAIISGVGTFVETGTDASPQFELRNFRGAFQLLTGTVLSGSTVAITFRATFTLNLKGVGTVIPEPGTFALLGGGLLAFGAAVARRRS